MVGKAICTLAVLAWALFTLDAAAQNKSASDKKDAAKRLKLKVNELLSDAEVLVQKDPEKAYDLLHRALDQLEEPSPLSRDERLTLMAKVEKRLGDARKEMTRSSSSTNGKASTASKKKDKDGKVGQLFVGTNFADVGVTPVVSGDRRFVRIGLRGSMGFVAPTGPPIPTQIPVPTFLYGPGINTTVTRPEKIFQIFFPAPKGTIIRFNSTVTVPSDGFASLGGYSSRMESRNEFGPPMVSKVPYLGRLFRNVGYGADLSTHSVGVSARIFSMEEEEQRFLARAGAK